MAYSHCLPRWIGSRRHDVSAISGLFHDTRRGGHLKVLNQLNPAPDLLISLGKISSGSFSKPFWQDRARIETVNCHVVSLLDVHCVKL